MGEDSAGLGGMQCFDLRRDQTTHRRSNGIAERERNSKANQIIMKKRTRGDYKTATAEHTVKWAVILSCLYTT